MKQKWKLALLLCAVALAVAIPTGFLLACRNSREVEPPSTRVEHTQEELPYTEEERLEMWYLELQWEAGAEQRRVEFVSAAQEAVAQWFLENQPENIWQLDDILAQIESNWYDRHFGFVGIQAMPHHACIEPELFEDEFTTGGYQFTEDETRMVLLAFQQLNPM